MTYNLEEIIEDIESIEQELDHSYEWIIERTVTETRSRRSYGIDTEHEEYEEVEVRGRVLDVSFCPDNVEVHTEERGTEHFEELDQRLFNYATGLQ